MFSVTYYAVAEHFSVHVYLLLWLRKDKKYQTRPTNQQPSKTIVLISPIICSDSWFF